MSDFGDPRDYQGRTYDVMALQGVKRVGVAPLSQELFNTTVSGTICTGVQKLGQRFLLEFLTEEGTMPYLPDRGCLFMTQLKAGNFRSQADVRLSFAIAVNTISVNLQNEEADDDPADERFLDAELLEVWITGTLLGLRIRVLSRDPSRQVILPIAVTV